MWAFRYLFYRLYRWQSRLESDVAPFNAFMLMVIFFSLNLVTLLGLAESFIGRSFLVANVPQKIAHVGVLILMGLMAVPLYFSLLYKKKYKHVVTEFESESRHQRCVRGIGVLLYLILSLVFLFAGAILHGKMTSH
jgi:hypothetical protein